jgi:hypothetical protein
LAVAFIAIAVGAVVVLPIFLNLFGLSTWHERLIAVARWPFLLVGVTAALSLIYRTAQAGEWRNGAGLREASPRQCYGSLCQCCSPGTLRSLTATIGCTGH